MVFAALDPEIKQKVLSAYLDGHGRNQITRELHEQGIKISHGSVSDFINAYKRKHEQPPSPPEQQASSGSNNAGIGESSPLFSGKGKATSVTPRDGGPLTHFFSSKDEDTMTTVPDSISSADGSPAPLKPEPQVEDNDVINSPEEPNPASTPSDLTYSPGWDPDDDQAMRTRFWARIMEEKEEKRKTLQLIEQKTHELNQEKQNLAQIRYSIDQWNNDLKARESKLIELEPFIPLAKQLQAMKIDIPNFLPWVESVHEYAVTRNMDLTTAAYNIAADLREYRQLGSLHKAIEHTRQQLSVLDAFTAQKQATASQLQMAGFTENDINKLINLKKNLWNKQPGFGFSLGALNSIIASIVVSISDIGWRWRW